jgi:anaerobic selenocysteine-containing dehydrogenase
MTENQYSNLWRPTACNLCYINCGIEVVTEGRRLTKIRGDKKHPDTKGYSCQKSASPRLLSKSSRSPDLAAAQTGRRHVRTN